MKTPALCLSLLIFAVIVAGCAAPTPIVREATCEITIVVPQNVVVERTVEVPVTVVVTMTPLPDTPTPAAKPNQDPNLHLAIQRGGAFLKRQYNPQLGLLAESPIVGPNNYWLNNDNSLAAHALSAIGERELSDKLTATLDRYGYPGNGFINVAWSEPIAWPPAVETNLTITQVGDDKILQEAHGSSALFLDWCEYSNLAFMGALNEFQRGHIDEAHSDYRAAMQAFDGIGFKDKAFLAGSGLYETYKLAWAILAGIRLGESMDSRLLPALLAKQGLSGGFYTHYLTSGEPQGDPNVETTSLALLALEASDRR
jgi:hypothetical protein